MIYIILSCLEVIIEFKDLEYSVVEGDRIYNVTVVKQGEPGEDIVVTISPIPDSSGPFPAMCKKMAT